MRLGERRGKPQRSLERSARSRCIARGMKSVAEVVERCGIGRRKAGRPGQAGQRVAMLAERAQREPQIAVRHREVGAQRYCTSQQRQCLGCTSSRGADRAERDQHFHAFRITRACLLQQCLGGLCTARRPCMCRLRKQGTDFAVDCR